MTNKWVAGKLPKRPMDANKGTFGKVLVVAGSKNYPGAAYLSCAASYRVGAGLVTLVTNETTKIIVSRKLPELTFLSFNEAFQKIKDYDVLLFGPGLGQSKKTTKLVAKLLKQKLPKTVVDGDGLNILAKIEDWWDRLNGEVILTPHLGEMTRLTNLPVEEIQENRAEVAKKFAQKWKQVLVLKGANSVVASPAGELVIASFANPLLATAGTGDVLSGVIAGFLAQGLTPFNAACVGVYIHGLAGEMIREKTGRAGMLASDLLPMLPKALLHVTEQRIS